MIDSILSYWDRKRGVEKSFWILFGILILISIFYIFGFSGVLSRYQLLEDKTLLKSGKTHTLSTLQPPSEILQKILDFNPSLHISALPSKGSMHSLQARGDFASLVEFLHFIESLEQTRILDYRLEQGESMTLWVRVVIAKSAFMRELGNIKPVFVFFNPSIMNLDMIINHKARISNHWYQVGDVLYGMRIKAIHPHSVILTHENYQITLGF